MNLVVATALLWGTAPGLAQIVAPSPPTALAQTTEADPAEQLAEAERLNQEGLELYRAGRYGEAEAYYQRALTIREAVLPENHLSIATSYNNLAAVYYDQGRYGESVAYYQRALAIDEAVLPESHPDIATSYHNLALLYQAQGRYGEAEAYYQRALALYEAVLPAEHPYIATSYDNLALLYQAQGRYGEAEAHYQYGLAIREAVLPAEHAHITTSYNNLAGLYRAQGRYEEAEIYYQRALAIRKAVLPAEHPHIAISYNNLALLYQAQGRYGEAEAYYQRALALYEAMLPKEHPSIATSHNNLALLYQDQGRYGEAEAYYQRAMAIREAVLSAEHPHIANSYNNLAGLYQAQGRYGEAEAYYQRALAIVEAVLPPEHPDIATSYDNLAGLYQAQGRYGEAEAYHQRALAIVEAVLPPEHPDIATSYNNLAGLYQAQGKTSQAASFLQQGVAIQETFLSLNLTLGSEVQKQAFIATLSSTTDVALSLNLQSAPSNPDATQLALTTLLRRKGRVLDAVTDSLQRLRQNLSSEEVALLDNYTQAQSQLAALLYQPLDSQDPEVYQAQVAALRQRAEQLENDLARRSAEFRIETAPVEMNAVQALIPVDAALVELVQYRPFNPAASYADRWGEPRYGAYVLHASGDVQAVDLGEASLIDEQVRDFQDKLLSGRGLGKPEFDLDTFQQSARALDALTMAKIRPLVGEATHLLLSPDSQLNLVPFAALVDEQGQYLVENYLLTYLTTGRDLLRLQATAPSRQPPVILANPDYTQADASGVDLVASTTRGENRRPSDMADLSFSPLPGTASEVAAIAPLLNNAVVLTEAQATENALKQVQAPSILHIATHGFFLANVPFLPPPSTDGPQLLASSTVGPPPTDAGDGSPSRLENPLLRSGLALAGANARSSSPEDGILTALEASSLNLYGTKLVVLSACETGVGEIANGEGVYGLRRALAIAGAESQLMSLWQVSDWGSSELMQGYYQQLSGGAGRSAALREVQLDLMQDPDYSHPYFWAPFIFSGSWTPLSDF